MPGYHWVSRSNIGVPGGTTNPTTAWLTPAGLANRVLSVPSFAGQGDVLVRTEVAVNIRASAVQPGSYGSFADSAVSQFIGDVGIVNGSTIDPSANGVGDFAFTWDGQWSLTALVYDWVGSIVPSWMSCTSNGYVTSHAQRGPASYGAVAPAFNLSVLTQGSSSYPYTTSAVRSSWVITARCLWKTP